MSDLGVDLEELRAFVALADSGSISRAAEELNTSRSRVRRLLDQLEASLGTTLVTRSREGMELTADGREFLPNARTVLGGVRALVTQTRQKQPTPTGRLRLGLQVGYPPDVAANITTLIHRAFGSTKLEHIVHERPAQLLPDRVDIAVCVGEQRASVPVIELKITTIRQRLFGSQAYIAKHGPFTSVEQLEGHLAAAWAGPERDGTVLHRTDGHHHAVQAALITSDERMLRELAANGLGLIYAPLHAPDIPNRPHLVPVLESDVGRDVAVRIMAPELLADLPRLQLLLRAARAAMSLVGR